MNKILAPLINIIVNHKKKILVFFGLYFFMFYLFFSFNDLGDLVATKISEATQGQVFLDFDHIDLSIVPQPSLALSKVTIETPFTPAVTAKWLYVAPNILSLLAFKPGVTVKARGFLGGDVDISASRGAKTQNRHKEKVNLELSEISLNSLAKLLSLPMKVDGTISGTLASEVDPDFGEQPTADLSFHAKKTVIPETNINSPLGAIGLPRLNLGEVLIEGHSEKGQLEISRFTAGKPGGDMYATLSGHIGMSLLKTGPTFQSQVGAYDVSVKLQVGEAAKRQLSGYLGMLRDYQIAANTYSFRASAPNAYSPPSFTKSVGP